LKNDERRNPSLTIKGYSSRYLGKSTTFVKQPCVLRKDSGSSQSKFPSICGLRMGRAGLSGAKTQGLPPWTINRMQMVVASLRLG